MGQRRRRSLLKGEGTEGEGTEDSASEPASPPPAAESAPGDPAPAPAPDPWGAPAPEPAAAPDPFAAAPSGWGGSNVPPADDVPPEVPGVPDPFGATGETAAANKAAAGYEVSEENRAVGGYATTTKNLSDSTDSGWSSSAFRTGAGEPSLPPGWDSPSAPKSSEPLRPASPFTQRQDFFSEEPPTEEQPSAVYENRGMPEAAPMNLPGGASPAARSGTPGRKDFGALGGGDSPYVSTGAPDVGASAAKNFGGSGGAAPPSSNRPAYLPPETPKKAPTRSPAPAPSRPSAAAGLDDDEDDRAGPPPMMLAIGFVVIVMGVVLLGLVVMIATGAFNPEPPPAPPPTVVALPPPPPQPVTTDTDVPVAVDPATVDPATVAPGTTPPGTATTPPGSTTPPGGTVAATTPPVETKVVKPPPDKVKETKKANKQPAAAKGTLKIRSNRRVLVKVNGQPKDYTPLDLPVEAGAYTITAALPGKPDSEQSFKVDLKAGATEPVNFSF